MRADVIRLEAAIEAFNRQLKTARLVAGTVEAEGDQN